MSEYDKLKEKGMGRGRPKLTPEQRKVSRDRNLARQEARRRAFIVLKSHHSEEFAKIYEQELRSLDVEIQEPRRSKSTRK